MQTIFDNIVFSLQRAGGISVVWKKLLERVLIEPDLSPRFLEYAGAKNNLFRKEIDIPEGLLLPPSRLPLYFERYISPVIFGDKDPFLFHSSYYRVSRNAKAVNITTVHDFTYEYYMKGLAREVHVRQKYHAFRHSEAIVCISENTKKDLFKFVPDIDPAKVFVIYNGVSDSYHPVEDKDPLYQDCVLFVGGRVGYKNFKYVAESLQNTKYRLLICGSPLSPEEIGFLDTTLGKNRYECKSFLPDAELNKLYNSVYCLAYPSSYEGFGIPVLEAQRAGCPVIAYPVSSIPEVIGDTPLLLKELTTKEMEEKLSMLEDAGLRESVVMAGLNNASRFSWSKMQEEYISLYRQLMAEKS